MAVFMSNVCKFNSCGRQFSSLWELIRHIEDNHLGMLKLEYVFRNLYSYTFGLKFLNSVDIDSSENDLPIVSLPVSCVLRIFSNQNDDLNSTESATLNDAQIRKSINSPAASLSTTTESSEIDEDAGFESDSGHSSIDSWATNDSSTHHLLKFQQMMGLGLCPNTGNPHTMATNTVDMSKLNGTNEEQRMYICNIAGCMKQYRNTNTLSHHRRTVHKINANGIGVARNSMIKNTAHVTAMNNSNSITAKMIIDPRTNENVKKYKCFCGKSYKTSHGLKNHSNIHHSDQMNVVSNQSLVRDNSNDVKEAIESMIGRPDSVGAMQSLAANNHQTNLKTSSIQQQIISMASNNVNPNMNHVKTEPVVATNLHNKKSGTIFAEIVPEFSVNVEVSSEPKKSQSSHNQSTNVSNNSCNLPAISAPTLQQHLLSPIIPKVSNQTY
uniref:C2H2-type domain-containing protein n=1 Tax=Sarcoptes scabiei TaxID=52283 RepID=A0A834R424_SARSC